MLDTVVGVNKGYKYVSPINFHKTNYCIQIGSKNIYIYN